MTDKMLRALPVSLVELAQALETYEGALSADHYLDLETGNVEMSFTGDGFFGDDELDEASSAFEAQPERYRWIPKTDKRSDYRLMARFVETVGELDPDIADSLGSALSGGDAFRRFRHTLERWPDWRQRWFDFKQQHHVQEAIDWLETHGLKSSIQWTPAQREPEPPPKPNKPHAPGMLALLVFGGPATLREGQVNRVATLATEGDARRCFVAVSRDVCGWNGIGWRKRFVKGVSEFRTETGWTVRHEGCTVTLELPLNPGAVTAMRP